MVSLLASWSHFFLFFSYSFTLYSRIASSRRNIVHANECTDIECAGIDGAATTSLLQKRFDIVQHQMPGKNPVLLDANVSTRLEPAGLPSSVKVGIANHGRLAPLTLLADVGYKDARCLDGSSGGYYFRQASSLASSKRWILHLEGGGECINEEDCGERIYEDTGSSKKWYPATHLVNYLVDEKGNHFGSWNAVVIPYCSGDAWTGTQTELGTTLPGLQFSGHNIFESTIDHLSAALSLGDAEEIILSGSSIGGTGAWISLDYLRERLPAVPNVVGCSFGGYLFLQSEGYLMYTGPGSSPPSVPLTPADMKRYYELWSSFVPTRCVEQSPESPWMCLLSSTVYNSLQTPVFLINSQFDYVSMQSHDGAGSASEVDLRDFSGRWRKALFSNAIGILGSGRDGVFMPACLMHTRFVPALRINGVTAVDAFARWYFKSSSTIKLIDTCAETNCNPTCSEVAEHPSSGWIVKLRA